jgi:two-component system LytT family sensor kinase
MDWLHHLIHSKQTSTRVLRHVLFWSADVVAYLLIVTDYSSVSRIQLFHGLLRLPLIIVATYFILYYLMPAFSHPRKRKTAYVWVGGVIVFLSVGVRFYKHYIIAPWIDPAGEVPQPIWDVARLTSELLAASMVISAAIVIKLLKNRHELTRQNEELLHEKKAAELNFLKAQMHPHFLFNTLNTLYSETIQDSGKAQAVVLHLSNLLRFILDECNKSRIPLGYEVKVIRDFIALEQLRHGERLAVTLHVSDVDVTRLISPLVLLPFVENSFKHSLNTVRGPIHIDIQIGMQGDRLHLQVVNDCAPGKNMNGQSHGKGIPNVKRQLELLYAGEYELAMTDKKDQYHVSLTLPLRS